MKTEATRNRRYNTSRNIVGIIDESAKEFAGENKKSERFLIAVMFGYANTYWNRKKIIAERRANEKDFDKKKFEADAKTAIASLSEKTKEILSSTYLDAWISGIGDISNPKGIVWEIQKRCEMPSIVTEHVAEYAAAQILEDALKNMSFDFESKTKDILKTIRRNINSAILNGDFSQRSQLFVGMLSPCEKDFDNPDLYREYQDSERIYYNLVELTKRTSAHGKLVGITLCDLTSGPKEEEILARCRSLCVREMNKTLYGREFFKSHTGFSFC